MAVVVDECGSPNVQIEKENHTKNNPTKPANKRDGEEGTETTENCGVTAPDSSDEMRQGTLDSPQKSHHESDTRKRHAVWGSRTGVVRPGCIERMRATGMFV